VEPDRTIYLAVPEDTFKNELFQGRFIQKRLREEQVNLIVFDIDTNEIKLWKNY
jgi:hypothetical protein